MNKPDNNDVFDWDLWEIQLKYINLLLSANRKYGHYELTTNKPKRLKEVK